MAEHGHDDHVHLEYQPALPINNGKVFLWLFLSTEIMFFAGLIGTYIVLRFGVPPGTWPAPKDVHVEEFVGAANTFVLICSSATVVFALESARKNRPGRARNYLLLTFLLGAVFLGVKLYEYYSKFSHGIHPAFGAVNAAFDHADPDSDRSLLYERADVYYVSAVGKKLMLHRTQLEKEKTELVELPAKKEEAERQLEQLPSRSRRWANRSLRRPRRSRKSRICPRWNSRRTCSTCHKSSSPR